MLSRNKRGEAGLSGVGGEMLCCAAIIRYVTVRSLGEIGK